MDAAQAAFEDWANLLPQDRSAILRRLVRVADCHKEDLARIMVLEQGKPLSEACGEIDYGAAFVEFMPRRPSAPISRA